MFQKLHREGFIFVYHLKLFSPVHEVRRFGCSYCLSTCFTVAYQLAFYCIWQARLFKTGLKNVLKYWLARKLKTTTTTAEVSLLTGLPRCPLLRRQCCY